VLVKGFKNEELALKWLEKLNILEESRQLYCIDSVEVFFFISGNLTFISFFLLENEGICGAAFIRLGRS